MKVTFIIPTFDRVYPLRSMLYSLLAQNNPNWDAIVMVDDVRSGQKLHELSDIEDSRIQYMFTNTRYNDWGHTPREMGKQMAKGDYIVMTGDDNYYVPSFVDELCKATQDNPGIVYWDMIHNGYNYHHFECRLSTGFIDMGAFATRRDLAYQLHLNCKLLTADGQFAVDFCEKFPQEKQVKINKILFIHN